MTTPPHADDVPDDVVERAIDTLLDIAPQRRDVALRELIDRHPEHRAALHAFMEDLAGAERLLDRGFHAERTDPIEIGPYRSVRTLGEGAFGIVYLCEQSTPIRRRVAVKLLRSGAGDVNTLARFDAERQSLAQLGHPTIAHVFDAGTLPDGRPYFVMEFVDGVPITHYCTDHALSIEARLRLFLLLCRGVEHAHKNGIVHRDLKPANVLVVTTESGPLPKIIDFGIAKAVHATARRDAFLTEAGRVIGTPGYMSPEQASGEVQDVDGRADVFALGVLLFELLTGELPWGRKGGTVDTDPPRPSSRVSGARARGTTTTGTLGRRQLVARLRGDLDWIALRALAFDRERRYPTARELADDVDRHLRGQPVTAGPPSLAYRLRKLVRRHRGATWAAGVAAAAIAFGIAYPMLRDAEAATTVAGAHAEVARAAQALLQQANSPSVRKAPASDAIRGALAHDALAMCDRLLAIHTTDPALRAGRCDALLTISQVHWLLGQFDRAAASADAARADAEALRALDASTANRGRLAEARRKKGRALALSGQDAAARAEFEFATSELAALATEQPKAWGLSYGSVLREVARSRWTAGENDAGMAALRESLRVLEALSGEQPESATVRRDAVFSRFALGQQLVILGATDAGEPELVRAERELHDLPDDVELHAKVTAVLGRLADARNDVPLAIQRYEAAVGTYERWQEAEPGHFEARRELSVVLTSFARALARGERWADSSAALRRAVDVAAANLAAFPRDSARASDLCATLGQAARFLWDRQRRADLFDAEEYARRAVEVWPQTGVARPRWVYVAMLAMVRDAAGASTDELWNEVAGQVTGDGTEGEQLEAWIGIARCHLRAARLADAAAAIERCRAVDGERTAAPWKSAVEALWIEGRIAALRDDHAAAARAAESILALRRSWSTRALAAECLDAARACAGAEGANATYREQVADLCDANVRQLTPDVEAHPDDPWFVVPFGAASIRLARASSERGESAAALALLARAMPLLDGVEALAHVDQWDAALVATGRELFARLQRG